MSIRRSRRVGGSRPRYSGATYRSDHPQASRLQLRWATAIPSAEWSLYKCAISAMHGAGVQFMIGGGFAFAAYTGRWRDTKDIDFYLKPQQREQAIAALERAGFKDYFERLPYDRKWIYRGIRSGVIVDIIWAMANQRAQVDDLWLQRARPLSLRDQKLQVIPIEELIWSKLYIVQRDRCDWTDIFNLLYARGGQLDWKHLIRRLGDDRPLLHSLLTLYRWLCPRSALGFPRHVWRPSTLRGTSGQEALRRSRLLDSRAWFAPMQVANRKLEI